VFWTAGGKLRRAGIDGSLPTSLGAVQGGCLKWKSATSLLAANTTTGEILVVDPANGSSTQVTINATAPWGVAPLSGADFFYTNYDTTTGKIRKGNGDLSISNPTLLSNQAGHRQRRRDDGTGLVARRWPPHGFPRNSLRNGHLSAGVS
jgi:hypothetical protein